MSIYNPYSLVLFRNSFSHCWNILQLYFYGKLITLFTARLKPYYAVSEKEIELTKW